MQSVLANFEELLQRVRQGRDFGHTSFEPVYYLIYHPKELLEVKRQMPAWRSRLKQDGWTPTEFSAADHVLEVCRTAKMRHFWLKADGNAPLDWRKTNAALANAIAKQQLADRLKSTLESAGQDDNGMVLVTDLESLHPYTRIGAIETQLYGHFCVPTIILYPGERTGKTRLSFLGFYPEDGNYRSVHVGG